MAGADYIKSSTYLAGYNPDGCYGAVASTVEGGWVKMCCWQNRDVFKHTWKWERDSPAAACQVRHYT